MSAAVTTVALKPPRHILVNGHKIHLRFVQNLLWVVIVTSLAVAAVAALYYGLFETTHVMKAWWDGLFTQDWWTNYRHGLRNFGEPVLAAMAVHSLIVSGWRKHEDVRLTGVHLAVRALMTLLAAFGTIILGVWLVNYSLPWLWHKTLGHDHIGSLHASSAVSNVFSGIDWKAFVLSFIIVHLIRSIWSPVGNTISLVFTEQAVYRAHGRTPVWVRLPLAPPAMRERFSWIQQSTPDLKPRRDFATRLLMVIIILMVPLAAYGEYVLHVIAKGK